MSSSPRSVRITPLWNRTVQHAPWPTAMTIPLLPVSIAGPNGPASARRAATWSPGLQRNGARAALDVVADADEAAADEAAAADDAAADSWPSVRAAGVQGRRGRGTPVRGSPAGVAGGVAGSRVDDRPGRRGAVTWITRPISSASTPVAGIRSLRRPPDAGVLPGGRSRLTARRRPTGQQAPIAGPGLAHHSVVVRAQLLVGPVESGGVVQRGHAEIGLQP